MPTTRDVLNSVFDATNNKLNVTATATVAAAVDIATIAAGDTNIGNVDVASIAAGTNLIGKVGIDQVTANANEVVLKAGTASVGGTTDNGPHWTSSYLYTVSADATGIVDVTAAPTGGQKIVVTDIICSTDTAMNLIFQEETSGTAVLKLFLPANGSAQITPRSKFKLPTADKKLRVDASVAGNIAVTVFYYSES